MTLDRRTDDSSKPLVSVVSITYNQSRYVKQALDSFLSQVTNFDYEIIVCDDASTDGTSEIVSRYAQEHPAQVHATLRKKNIGAQSNLIDALGRAKGEYIALCDGDDYWTDSTKLQQQVDVLEKNPGINLCFHRTNVIFDDSSHPEATFPRDDKGFTRNNLIKKNFIPTNSVMYRRTTSYAMASEVMPLDWYLHLYHVRDGEIGFIDKVMSVYRRHEGGVWWQSHQNLDKLWIKYGVDHARFYKELAVMLQEDENAIRIIDRLRSEFLSDVVQIDYRNKTTLLQDILVHFPDLSSLAVLEIQKHFSLAKQSLNDANSEIEDLKRAVEKSQKLTNETKSRLMESQRVISEVTGSKTWRLKQKIGKIRHRR